MSASVAEIEKSILSAILAGKIRPGAHLGEAQLADVFAVSRTKIREALVRLDTRGVVTVSPRRGWFVAEPSAEEAHEAFQTRKIVETGLLHSAPSIPAGALANLKRHIKAERQAITADDIGLRVCLLRDFHLHIADLLGNPLLSKIVRDLTARTTLVSMLYQPKEKAAESSHDHKHIVDALEKGDFAAAAALMSLHIDEVEAGLDLSTRLDPLTALRETLLPPSLAQAASGPPPAPGHTASSTTAMKGPDR